jgi:uncharacterized Ntn-hydrolase superfamily protein
MKPHQAKLLPAVFALALTSLALAAPPSPSTFSIAAADPESGEVGVAVASRFFAVGSVVPFAKAGVGAVATQSFANTTYGPRGLELLERGVTADEVVRVLTRGDDGREQRQLGVVAANGSASTYTGTKCNAWAGGRTGPNFAVQGNILAGEAVVAGMERAFLDTKGQTLAERLYAAIVAGDKAGGDARGRQSMALLVARAKGGYGGFTDRAVDLRVDDHADPIVEMGRLLGIGLVNDLWNRGWTAFTEKHFAKARAFQERAATMAEKQPAVLPEVLYDLAVIRLAAGDKEGAVTALDRALVLNPKLKAQSEKDPDLEKLK